VKMTFTFGAFARSKVDWAKAGTAHGDVKMADTCSTEGLRGLNRGR
jgi:hypothetical protein